MTHWHAVNDALSPVDAARCVYPTRVRARNMQNVWLRGAQTYHWQADPVGVAGWLLRSPDGVTYIDVKACDEATCRVQP